MTDQEIARHPPGLTDFEKPDYDHSTGRREKGLSVTTTTTVGGGVGNKID